MRVYHRDRILDSLESGLIRASLGGEAAVTSLPRNGAGRDFVVGDVHGMFRRLETVLRELGFRADSDRLISVGDLIDRGPDSQQADRWIRDFPWFHAVRGNHDQMLLDALTGPDDPGSGVMELWIRYNGGDWWLDTDEPRRRSLARAMASLPLAMEIECECGRVGVVHADVPPDRDWSSFLLALRSGTREDIAHALWSRFRLIGYLAGEYPVDDVAVAGIDLVVSGHVPLNMPSQAANRWWIDTGAAYAGRLADPKFTLLQISPGVPVAFTFQCGRSSL